MSREFNVIARDTCRHLLKKPVKTKFLHLHWTQVTKIWLTASRSTTNQFGRS